MDAFDLQLLHCNMIITVLILIKETFFSLKKCSGLHVGATEGYVPSATVERLSPTGTGLGDRGLTFALSTLK